MPRFEIIPAKPWHCGIAARNARAEHRAAVKALGLDLHRELSARFADTLEPKAWMIDGKLAALGGVMCTALCPGGYVWLTITEEATKHPLALVREARRQLELAMALQSELATVLIPEDKAALRLAVYLGFHVKDEGLGSVAHDRAGRIALRRYLEAAAELRIPMGSGGAIPVGYHKEAA
jgi:hypothetical protein